MLDNIEWRPPYQPPVVENKQDPQQVKNPQQIPENPSRPNALANFNNYSMPGQTTLAQAKPSNPSSPIPVDKKEAWFSNTQIKNIQDGSYKNYHQVTIEDRGKEKTLLVGKDGTNAKGFVLENKPGTKSGEYSAHKLPSYSSFYEEAKKLHFDTKDAKHLGLVGKEGNQYQKFELKDGRHAFYGNDAGNRGYGYIDNGQVQKLSDHTKSQLTKQIPAELRLKNDVNKFVDRVNANPEMKKLYESMRGANALSKISENVLGLAIGEANANQIMGNDELSKMTPEEGLKKLETELAKDPDRAFAGLANIMKSKEFDNPGLIDHANYLLDHHNKPLEGKAAEDFKTNVDKLLGLNPTLLKTKYPEFYDIQQNFKLREERGGPYTELDRNKIDGQRLMSRDFKLAYLRSKSFE